MATPRGVPGICASCFWPENLRYVREEDVDVCS